MLFWARSIKNSFILSDSVTTFLIMKSHKRKRNCLITNKTDFFVAKVVNLYVGVTITIKRNFRQKNHSKN